MPSAGSPDDAASRCVDISGSESGSSFDPCVPRSSIAAADLGALCESNYPKRCGDTLYQVICACPEGTCACIRTEIGGNDAAVEDAGAKSSSHVVAIGTCPNCPSQGQARYALCGVPY